MSISAKVKTCFLFTGGVINGNSSNINNNTINDEGEDSKLGISDNGRVKRVNCSSPRAPLVSPDTDCVSEEDAEEFAEQVGDLDFSLLPPSCNILDDVTAATQDGVGVTEDENCSSKRGFPVPNVADFEVKVSSLLFFQAQDEPKIKVERVVSKLSCANILN